MKGILNYIATSLASGIIYALLCLLLDYLFGDLKENLWMYPVTGLLFGFSIEAVRKFIDKHHKDDNAKN